MSECFQNQKILARTFLSFSSSLANTHLANNVLDQLLKLKKLRVLSLRNYDIRELPDSIGDLKHLRYLDLSRTKIKNLPESTCSLYNLQMLSLEGCNQLKKLPSKMENLINLCYLDIEGCHKLKEMPIGVKELKSLRELSNFLVSKDGGCGVQELKNFKDLRGSLRISNLKDVIDANADAREAILKEKKLDVLVLEWGESSGDVRNAADTEQIVLDMLQPNQNLKELRIKDYAGNEFSKWLRDPSFSSYMTQLELYNCERCTCLPSLGQFPSLKVLKIGGMKAVQSVGSEFYGSTGQSKIFPSLEYLSFINMPEWENWIRCEDSDKQVEVFSSLSKLDLLNCPKLLGKLPNHLLMLKKLEIRRCEKLNFNGSEELISRNLPCGVEDLPSIDCARIERLAITSFNLKQLRKLHISNCLNLENLEWLHEYLNSLQKVEIINCPRLISFPQGGLASTNLRDLKIMNCENLMALPNGMCNLTSLSIEGCPRMKFVPEEGFLANLITLNIYKGAENILRQLIEWGFHRLTCLKYLEIYGGKDCVMEEMIEINLPTSLTKLIIVGFPKLVALSLSLPISLTVLEIIRCPNLEYMSCSNGFHNLTSLNWLNIQDCPKLKSLPKEGLPPSLDWLIIFKCPLVSERCKRDKGEDWPKIANIPHVYIEVWEYDSDSDSWEYDSD